MLINIEQLACMYVSDYARYWTQTTDENDISDDDYVDRETGRIGHSCDFRCGDIVELAEGTYVMHNGELKEADLHDGDSKYFELWRINKDTGFFMYSDYWDVEVQSVTFNHRRYTHQLVNNIGIMTSGTVKVPYTWATINGQRFYIYACNCYDDSIDGDCLYSSGYKNSDMIDIKNEMANMFKTDSNLSYLSRWPGYDFDVNDRHREDFERIFPGIDFNESRVNVLWIPTIEL